MTKEDLKKSEQDFKKKIKEVPAKNKKFWERQLKNVQTKLYGN